MIPATTKAPAAVASPTSGSLLTDGECASGGAVRAAAGAPSSSAPTSGQGTGVDCPPLQGKGVGADLSYERALGFPHDGDYDLPLRSTMPAGATPAAPCLDCGAYVGHVAGCRP